MAEALAVGIDIGGTKIAAGVVDAGGRILARVRRPTPSTDPRAVVDVIGEVVEEFGRTFEVAAVGIGAAGYIDASRSTVVFSPHLAWRQEPLRDLAARRTGLPVLVDNDANTAGWAESQFGAARGESEAVVVNLGTGIGGAIVWDGHLQRGRFGMAGEFGHQRMVDDGLPCECGNRGCWEQYASGRVLERRARDAVAAGSAIGVDLASAVGGVAQIDGRTVGLLAAQGHHEALAWVAEVGRWLGIGLANLAAVLDPGLFVIGGGVGELGEPLLGPARVAFDEHLTGGGHREQAAIVAAQLGNDAGLIGAADLARRHAR